MAYFVSYARGDDDSYVAKFRRDLSEAVQDRGRRDRALPNGWPSGSGDTPATCQAFVALCSPRYFLSDRCGREWSTFTRRLDRYHRETGRTPASLIPVVWAGTRLLDAARDVPGWQDATSPPFAEHELRQLIRLHSRRQDYEDVVAALADRILAVAREHHLPPEPPAADPESAANAFAGLPQRLLDDAAQYVHLVVAAGSREQMKEVRGDVQFYGERGQDWAPFRPDMSESLAAHARKLISERLFGSGVSDLDRLGDRAERARRNNEILVLLVDAWATRLADFQQVLADFDSRDESSAVLVPANRDDPESTGYRRDLSSRVSRTFPHSIARRDLLFRADIETALGFDADLLDVVEEAQNRIFRKGRVFRRPPDIPPGQRPILEGP
ncbi:MAG TPA: FxsC protein [Rugosimonospora sp.]|nr:FxsC protein [Rugosimonospora sp.]